MTPRSKRKPHGFPIKLHHLTKKKSLEVSWVVPRNEATFDSILKYSVIRVTDVVN